MVLADHGETSESESMVAKAMVISKNLNGLDWEASHGEKNFDGLVFFHDR